MAQSMVGLTLRHPWAWAICYAGKNCENRTWKPHPNRLRPGQWFGLHGGGYPREERWNEALADLAALQNLGLVSRALNLKDVIVEGICAVLQYEGTVHQTQGGPIRNSPWFAGPVAWTWSRMIVLPEPVPSRGAQGLWDVPQDVLHRVLEQCGEVMGRG